MCIRDRIYTHGIASLCATNMCRFTEEEISKMITEVFISLLKEEKAGKCYDLSLIHILNLPVPDKKFFVEHLHL